MKIKGKKIYGLTIYIAYYFVILLIPLLVVVFGYTINYSNTRKNFIENQAADLYQYSGLCDSYIQSVQQLAYQFSTNYQIKEFSSNESPSGQNAVAADMYHMHSTLQPYMVTCNYIEDIQIGFKKSKIVIAGNKIWSNMEALWKLQYKDYYPSYEAWQDWFLHGEEGLQAVCNVSEDEGAQLLYRKRVQASLPDSGYDILIFFDMDYMKETLSSSGREGVTAFFLYDDISLMESENSAHGQIKEKVTAQTEKSGYFSDNIEDKKVIVAFRKSDWTDGVYVSVIHEKMIAESLRESRLFCAGIVVLTLIIAVVSALFFSFKTASPWVRLIRMLELEITGGKKEPPYSIVKRQIEKINRGNERLREQLDNLKTAMLSNLMNQVMTGQFKDEEELAAGFAELGYRILAKHYIVVIVTINEADTNKEITMYRLLMENVFRKNIDNLIGFYEMDIRDEALLLTSEEENYVDTLSQVEKKLTELQAKVLDEYGINISFSGSMCTKTENIFQCVQEAKIATGYETKINNLSVSWFKKTWKKNETYSYSLNMEVDLFNEAVKGNVKKVNSLLEKIEKDNFIRNQCSEDSAVRLIDGMMATVYRLTEEKEEIEKLTHEKIAFVRQCIEQKRVRRAFDAVCETINDISDYFNQGVYANENLYRRVLLFIENNYTDSQLSLTMVADTFNRTEIYLSKFFKEKNGTNFLKFVESLRMNMAQELLQDSALSVQTIAEKIGYNSSQVFRRVYKKYYGKTPRE